MDCNNQGRIIPMSLLMDCNYNFIYGKNIRNEANNKLKLVREK